MKFSERIGITKPKTELTKEELPDDLRNTLWSIIYEHINDRISDGRQMGQKYSEQVKLFKNIWLSFMKLPIDEFKNHINHHGELNSDYPFIRLRNWFFDSKWYETYNFLEFLVNSEYGGKAFSFICNIYLIKELSAYRFVDGVLVEINSKEEIVEIEKALNVDDKFKNVREHISTSLKLLSDKQKPDYRNSVKESISAVESLGRIILHDKSITGGKALDQIEKDFNLPNTLMGGFKKIYGYTADKGGIRHGLKEQDHNVDIDEARFMLVSCSAFVNYLISKT